MQPLHVCTYVCIIYVHTGAGLIRVRLKPVGQEYIQYSSELFWGFQRVCISNRVIEQIISIEFEILHC